MAGFSRVARERAASLGYGAGLLAALLLFCAPGRAAAAHGSFDTVVIDPGHGGFDRGGIPGQRVAEKNMTLDVSQRVAKRLRAAGYHVIMTRDSDVFIPLGGRVAIGNSHRGAIFLCIHFNSATRPGANGIETYYYHSDSARLAANVHRQVVSKTETDNRGIRQRGFYVLRRTKIPAILVECGFLTNPAEARLALQSSYRERLAEAIAAGVEGKAAPFNRPVVGGLTHVRSPLGESSSGFNDFVRAEPERRPSLRHHRSRSSRSSSRHSSSQHSTKKKKSSKKKKKKSDD